MSDFLLVATAILFSSVFFKSLVIFTLVFFALGLRNISFTLVALLLAIFSGGYSLEKSVSSKEELQSISFYNLRFSIPKPESLILLQEKNTDLKINANVAEFAPVSGAQLSFVITQLEAGIKVALPLIIPFLLVDIVIATVCFLLNFDGISQSLLAVPIKLFLLLSTGGLLMLIEKIFATSWHSV
jgi:type III secretory pathway component EscR